MSICKRLSNVNRELIDSEFESLSLKLDKDLSDAEKLVSNIKVKLESLSKQADHLSNEKQDLMEDVGSIKELRSKLIKVIFINAVVDVILLVVLIVVNL